MTNTNDSAAQRTKTEQADLETAGKRAKLAARPHPYWVKLQKNRYLGFRRTTAGSAGNWIARIQLGRKEVTEPLGKLDHIDEKLRFKEAARLAAQWFNERERDGVGATIIPSKLLLRFVLREYVADRRTEKGDKVADAAQRRLDMLITGYVDKRGAGIVDLPLSKVTKAQWMDWLAWLKELPTRGRGKVPAKRTGASVNRDLATVRACLNLAHRKHNIADVWKDVMKRNLKADVSRDHTAVLSQPDRAALMQGAQDAGVPEWVPFATLQLIVPVRVGAVAALEVRDYDRKAHALKIRKDKAGAGRTVALPPSPECKALMAAAIKSKLPSAPLFADADGLPWNSNTWNDAIKAAAEAAGLSSALTMYHLRHTRITDLINGDPARNIAGVPAMSIAKVAGTSVSQIEKHYHHLLDSVMQQALMLRAY